MSEQQFNTTYFPFLWLSLRLWYGFHVPMRTGCTFAPVHIQLLLMSRVHVQPKYAVRDSRACSMMGIYSIHSLSNFYGSSKVILTNDLKIREIPNTCSIVPKLCNRWSHLNYIPNMPVSIQARTSRQLVRWSIHRSRKFWELLWLWQCTFFL